MHLLGSYETKTGKKYRMVHKTCTRERVRKYLHARKSVIKKGDYEVIKFVEE